MAKSRRRVAQDQWWRNARPLTAAEKLRARFESPFNKKEVEQRTVKGRRLSLRLHTDDGDDVWFVYELQYGHIHPKYIKHMRSRPEKQADWL